MYKVFFLLTFLVCKITFSNGWSISDLYPDSSVKFKRETVNNTGCLLPQHPQHGHYQLSHGTSAYKVNAIAATGNLINITCDQGYTPGKSVFSVCNENRWIPELPQCIGTCPTISQTESNDVKCSLEEEEVSCENPIEGTSVQIICKPLYHQPGIRTTPICTDGNWNQLIQPCIPECGRKLVKPETLVIDDSDVQKGEYPWMVAIYNTSLNDKQHICGGSIISRVFVLSGAHCFADSEGVVYDKSFFTVVAGKYYRDLDIAEPESQARKIKRLFVHEDYKGRLTKYHNDIALIEVEEFVITLQVQPVCIDWNSIYEENDFMDGTRAVVARWEFATESSIPSGVLKKLVVPFWSTNTCRQFTDPDFFTQYYSSDKICAGYKDQASNICGIHAGGGLFFRSEPTRYFIRGLVSVAPRPQTGCNSIHYALFTKVSKYVPWLKIMTRRRL